MLADKSTLAAQLLVALYGLKLKLTFRNFAESRFSRKYIL